LHETVKDILVAVKELPPILVSSLEKVLAERFGSAPSGTGSSGTFKAKVDGELLNKLA
jgi:hypothetical protein